MKKTALILTFLCLLPLFSCQKEFIENETANTLGEQIIFDLSDKDLNVGIKTKTTQITELPSSLYWSASKGTQGSNESTVYASTSATVTDGKISTGKYQTATATTYNYYVTNLPITFASTGSTIQASNTTDVIAGTASSSSTNVSVALNHIFARTGTFTVTGIDDYTVTGTPTWKISGKGTAGKYNIATKSWSSVTSLSKTNVTNASDLYLVPGEYTIECTCSVKKGDYTATVTKSASNITLSAGYINNINAKIKGDASEIKISVSLTPWDTQTIDVGELN